MRMTTLESLARGGVILAGINTTMPSSTTAKISRAYLLFSRNGESVAKVRELTDALRDAYGARCRR